jgi:hypothetical protein
VKSRRGEGITSGHHELGHSSIPLVAFQALGWLRLGPLSTFSSQRPAPLMMLRHLLELNT